ncbi:MAG: DUF362 domain-containing protein, partial [Desulfobulbaceae bacterium]|nr:DUF362 domain-containing protein [Desulfobulbaceae bacterium]
MQLDSTIVALARCPGYQAGNLARAIDTVISAVDPPENLTSCHVLLKPNLISAKKGTLPCTEGAFLLAVARWFLDRGAVVSVGDSPAFGTTTSVLARLEYTDQLQKLGVGLVNFSRVRTVILPSGIQVGMAADALDCDLLVNLPRVKAHAQLRITLAVKNCFGCLAGLRKPWWHMMYGGKQGRFADLLVELLSILPDSLHLADGI